MTTCFLHREIREKGGAYGGGAHHRSGTFEFYSYRDPNIQETLESFNKSIDWIQRGEFTQQDLDEAKLKLFSSIDTPLAPYQRGKTLFLHGISHEMRQRFVCLSVCLFDDQIEIKLIFSFEKKNRNRDLIFATNKDDLSRVAKEYLSEPSKFSIAALAKQDIDNELLKGQGWHIEPLE